MPLEWLTNYEQFHQNSEPVQTSQAVFERCSDGQVKMSFQTPDKPNPDPQRLSYTAEKSQIFQSMDFPQKDI